MSDFSNIKPTTYDALGLGLPQPEPKDGNELGQSESDVRETLMGMAKSGGERFGVRYATTFEVLTP